MDKDLQNSDLIDTADSVAPVAGHESSLSLFAGQRQLEAADRKTLEHLLKAGMGANSLRALKSDLAYLQAWSSLAFGTALQWPAQENDILTFIAHHLWDPDQRAVDATHGMPDHVDEGLRLGGYLRSPGPHAPATVRRRLSSWKAVARVKGEDTAFGSPLIAQTLKAAARANAHQKKPKSRKPVEKELLLRLVEHLSSEAALGGPSQEDEGVRLRALRDAALVVTAFASGGRRRSEVAALTRSQVHFLPDLTSEEGHPLMAVGIDMGRTKTTNADDGEQVFVVGRAAAILKTWLNEGAITVGPVFRTIDRWGNMGAQALSGQSVNQILKARVAEIGEDPADFSFHGIRAGFITTAFKEGVPAPEIMQQTLHRSMQTLTGYFQSHERINSKAARLI